jgi:short-subunit dehydrogenase
MKQILVIGGTSGLGLELAKQHYELGFSVAITGRNNPNLDYLQFLPLDISSDSMRNHSSIIEILKNFTRVDTLIYSPGYYQEGYIKNISSDDILTMVNVNYITAVLLIHEILKKQPEQLKIIGITSSSEYTPREKEPIYSSTKAGLGMLLENLSLDPQIRKVVRIAPSGMNTDFWEQERTDFLDPIWVASEIMKVSSGTFAYRFAKITRNPAHTEIIAER